MRARFEWDAKKAQANRRKHGVSFDEALTVLGDPLAVIFTDEDHSFDEHREIIIGRSVLNRLLLVSFTEQPMGTVRIISARQTTRREKSDYEKHLKG